MTRDASWLCAGIRAEYQHVGIYCLLHQHLARLTLRHDAPNTLETAIQADHEIERVLNQRGSDGGCSRGSG